jgi:hypothetical protein
MSKPEIPAYIFALEEEVMRDLTAYNKAHQLYLRCSANNKNDNKQYIDKTNCPSTGSELLNNYNNAYAKLMKNTGPSNTHGSLIRLKNTMNWVSTNSPKEITQAEYMAIYSDILNKYKLINKQRQELDSKLTELYQIGDTTTNFYEKQLIATSYTKILLTVVATALTIGAFLTMRNST